MESSFSSLVPWTVSQFCLCIRGWAYMLSQHGWRHLIFCNAAPAPLRWKPSKWHLILVFFSLWNFCWCLRFATVFEWPVLAAKFLWSCRQISWMVGRVTGTENQRNLRGTGRRTFFLKSSYEQTNHVSIYNFMAPHHGMAGPWGCWSQTSGKEIKHKPSQSLDLRVTNISTLELCKIPFQEFVAIMSQSYPTPPPFISYPMNKNFLCSLISIQILRTEAFKFLVFKCNDFFFL